MTLFFSCSYIMHSNAFGSIWLQGDWAARGEMICAAAEAVDFGLSILNHTTNPRYQLGNQFQFDWTYFFCHVLDSSVLHHRIPSLHFSQGRADTIVNLPTITLFITRHTCAQHFPESWPTIFSSTHPANSIFHTGDPTRSNTYICDLCPSRTHLLPI